MPSSLAPCLVLLLAAAPPSGETGGDLASLVAAERAFSRTSVEKGTREAFLAFLAPNSVLFRPGPVPGRSWIKERPALPGTLSWDPVAAEVASSGDLGYTTGPWEFRPADGGSPNQGHYLSVWQRRGKGEWKVLLDVGVFTPPPAAPEPAWQGGGTPPPRWQAPEDAAADRAAAEAALLAREREIAHAAGSGPVTDHLDDLTADVRLLRNGRPPAQGGDAAREALDGIGRIAWTPETGGVAAGADLGYSYGAYELRRTGPEESMESGYYVRVWRREPDGGWRITVELLVHQPPPPPPDTPV